MIRWSAIAALVAPLALAGPAGAEAHLSVDFSWTGTAACTAKPPAFKLVGVPAGTKKLRFAMKDLDVPDFNHGGGTIDYTGSGNIPAGAFSYTGPCPPSGSHQYQWIVQALDASGRVLAAGQATKPFPPR